MTRTRSWCGLAAWIALCLAVAGLGAWATLPSLHGWYDQLTKPSWTPPGWLFGPVWTVLYVAMAVAAWLVWRRAGFAGQRLALGLFLVQLTLNAAWSEAFFALHLPAFALADIVALWAAILATLLAFRRASPAAAWLLAPYLLWVSFAAALNGAIWYMN